MYPTLRRHYHTQTMQVKEKIENLFEDIQSVAKRQPGLFASIWIAIFVVLVVVLVAVGFAPSALTDNDDSDKKDKKDKEVEVEDGEVFDAAIAEAAPPTLEDETSKEDMVDDMNSVPVRVVIESIGVDTIVSNPTDADLTVLNDALLKGAVRYPGSGTMEQTTNMFIFGHSSHLPVVKNKAFQSFNDLEDLTMGDLIKVQSESKEYHYRVSSVQLVDAEDAWVSFDSDTKKLTLSTCNNFGHAQDRFVVQADFVASILLENPA